MAPTSSAGPNPVSTWIGKKVSDICDILQIVTLIVKVVVMQVFATKLNNVPIIALSSGGQIAITQRPVIDPATLKIVALACNDNLLLLSKDIRQYDSELILVNSEDDLIESGEVIRLQPLLATDFRLIGATVKTELGVTLGRVSDYSFDVKTLDIVQLYVKPPLLKSLISQTLVIHRRQIVEITPPLITVRDASAKQALSTARPVASK